MVSISELEELEKAEKSIQNKIDGGFESESYRFGKLILEDDRELIPENLRKNFWISFDKELALSNLSEEDVKWILLQFDIAKIDYMMSYPEHRLDFDIVKDFDMLKIKLITKIKRSTGGMTRERGLFAQQHQIRQLITNEPEQPKGGILSRITGIFGGRK